ncbi:1-acyl-sn-glycerol-3-phosphate acyltransferase [Actinoplanes lutulentus]|uniref:1-acyl-sn-glycerol-3-phosphate acyltransferase n=1 Tax=Actinoplanes lutulentus TaxID=1287878 RepID=A0A327ZJB5_9ACTN|nr:1-acyl-sn-glycerol-3-phosphate acyltransferase [Actinoplanes lutulentus]
MARVLSVAFWAFFAVSSLVFIGGVALIRLVTFPFDRRRVVLHMYAAAWGSIYLWVNPLWRLRVRGRDRLPWHGGAILVANHASMIDILALQTLYRPIKWVSKQELFKTPVVGWYMRLSDCVAVKRGDSESVRLMKEHCDRLLDAGSQLAMFPEGTRTRDGSLLPFKDGAFELAIRHNVPIIPIAVHGTRQALPAQGLVMRERADILVEVLPPLLPADFPGTAELRDAARQVISDALVAAGSPVR